MVESIRMCPSGRAYISDGPDFPSQLLLDGGVIHNAVEILKNFDAHDQVRKGCLVR